jgi:hypothetical protein
MTIEADVAATLRNDRVRAAVDFSWWCYRISPEMLERVARFVEDGRIEVYGGSGSVPSYYSADDSLTFSFDSPTTWVQRAAIVHEATHAACDLAEYTEMTVRDSECAAYLAQCLAGRALCDDPDVDIIAGSGATAAASDLIFGEAWTLAVFVETEPGYRVSRQMGADLRAAVEAHPWYQNRAMQSAEYNGNHRPAAQAALEPEPFRPRCAGARPSCTRGWGTARA